MKQISTLLASILLFPLLASANSTSLINQKILEVAMQYPRNGGYNEKWTGSGTPYAIFFKGKQILPASQNGTYCCGFTFTVVMKVASQEGLLLNKTYPQIKAFQKQWYGATENFEEKQSAKALEYLGIGKPINRQDALPGDFIQFWREKSGHSAILIKWILNEHNQKVGFIYLSSQKSTNGVGYQTEYFKNTKKGSIDPKRTYFSRLMSASTQKKTRKQTASDHFWGFLNKKHQGVY